MPRHFDRMRKQVAVEGGVLGEQPVQRQHRRRGHQFVEADLAGRDPGPVAVGQTVFGIGLAVADAFENHPQITAPVPDWT